MSVQDFFESDGFDQSMDVSASTRKFQQSVVVKQDPNKSGILAFLSRVEQETIQQPQQQGSQSTMSTSAPTGYQS